MPITRNIVKQFGAAVACLLLLALWTEMALAAPAPLSIKSAVYNKKAASLIVKTHVKDPGGLLTLLHSKGGVLGQTQKSDDIFTIPLAQLGEIPCQVEARLGELKISKAVAGAGAECSKVPTCKILPFAKNTKPEFNKSFTFEAQVALKDKKAAPLTVEWDFAGGVMGHPYEKLLNPNTNKPILNGKVKQEATFVRDNSRYHVRFSAHDNLGRRCESGVYVDIGQPTTDLPDARALADMVEASQTSAPAKGSALKIPAGEKVVLPFQDWTMQTASDARTVPDVYVVYGPQVNNINATVYEKARKPVVIGPTKIKLKYSAAANPADPVGPNSINSTSQNYPVGNGLMDASVQKGDYFETPQNPVNTSALNYSFTGFLSPELATAADEGYHNPALTPPINPEHGLYMPGITSPYVDNIPQPFSDYVEADNMFAAHMLPLTDIDDSGRVNPTPLFRIEANDTKSDTPIAATDIVVNSGRDLHCRECHAKGKIGANPDRPYTFPETGHNHGGGGAHRPLDFFESDSDSLFDQEYAAIRNIANLHNYEGMHTGESIWAWMELHEGGMSDSGNPINGPRGCNNSSCHTTELTRAPYQLPLVKPGAFMNNGGPLSADMHNFHGKLQYKNANKDDIVRNSEGLPPRRSGLEEKWDPVTSSMPDSLFPVKDKEGNILPMEENCLKCHGGMREQCYRDRMYTAGVTCYQCHGDMLAVGNSFKKTIPGPDGNTYRQPWVDEPDCGSCHTGNANQGKAATDGFFSAGVMKTAFDESDRSATPRQPDLSNPDQSRFAVPVTPMEIGDYISSDLYGPQPFTTKTHLYRAGKDNHGQVACGACHGAGHAIWPNRDPNANDNVTALQLQGHSGPIAECSVCHTDDAFALRDDLDEGLKAADPMEHVLGGPHNMHPINDPNWWKQADGDLVDSTPDSPKRKDGTIKGGWHNDYAKYKGRAGEDQCAACHGNDHLGTRLSKTPVDREFINEKGKAIKVKAGTAIGCNLCHSVIKSCTDSPSKTDCGKTSSLTAGGTNLPPVINSAPVTLAVLGQDYRYAVQATDPEGGALSYQFVTPYADYLLAINFDTGEITIPTSAIENMVGNGGISPPADLTEYQVLVRDNRGAQTLQSVKVTVDCPDGLIFNTNTKVCVKILITSQPPFAALSVAQAYSHQVTAKQRSGEPLTFSLSGQPEGMSIDANGMINWTVPSNLVGLVSYKFKVNASDGQGGSAQQQANLAVCAAPKHWDPAGGCLGPINFTSRPTIEGINANSTPKETYSYQAHASQVDNLPLTYSLSNSPATMNIDSNSGLITWEPQASVSGDVFFTVNASDGQGGTAQQTLSVVVCAAPEFFGTGPTGSSQCLGPIEFTSSSGGGVDAGQTYSAQVTATHSGGLSLSYNLVGQPAGMTILSNTGEINWVAQAQPDTGGYVSFSVIATDSNGYAAKQDFAITVCVAPTYWDETIGGCHGPVHITSTQSVYGIDVGQTFSYQVVAADNDANGGAITYSLADAPASMTIDANTGLLSWVAEDTGGSDVAFTIYATDASEQMDQQSGYLMAPCVSPKHWNPDSNSCE